MVDLLRSTVEYGHTLKSPFAVCHITYRIIISLWVHKKIVLKTTVKWEQMVIMGMEDEMLLVYLGWL